MYVRQLTIENIRSIERFELKFEEGKQAGWHVILGDNGAGKSTIVRSLALILIGPGASAALRQDWSSWVHSEKERGKISLFFDGDDRDGCFAQWDLFSSRNYSLNLCIENENLGSYDSALVSGSEDLHGYYKRRGGEGWFSASFGPFRRLSGGDVGVERLFGENYHIGAHISAFGENVSLSEGFRWLCELRILDLEHRRLQDKENSQKGLKNLQKDGRDDLIGVRPDGERAGELLENIVDFINESELLPDSCWIQDVGADDISVVDPCGFDVPIAQLSDGYRSILSMIFEIMRLMTVSYGWDAMIGALDVENSAVRLPGVVSIDEVDAHLHPSWQKEIGPWFTRCFPEVQFIVTTHSPIICRNATTVWRLAAPGSDEPSGQIDGTTLDRLLYGSILEAYGTSLFGQGVERSDASRDMLQELAGLNRKLLRHGLDEDERKRLDELRRVLPTRASEAMTTHGSANASDC